MTDGNACAFSRSCSACRGTTRSNLVVRVGVDAHKKSLLSDSPSLNYFRKNFPSSSMLRRFSACT